MIIRNLVRVIDTGMMFIGVLSIMVDNNERRLGDLAAGTVVVLEHNSELPDNSKRQPGFGQCEVSRSRHAGHRSHYAAKLRVVAQLFKTPQDYGEKQRPVVALKLMEHFKEKLADAPSTKNPEEYLEGLYQAYRTRALT